MVKIKIIVIYCLKFLQDIRNLLFLLLDSNMEQGATLLLSHTNGNNTYDSNNML